MAPTIVRAPALRGTHQAPRPLSRGCAATFQICRYSLTLLVPPARLTFPLSREIDGQRLPTTAGWISRAHSRSTPLVGYYSHNQQFPPPNKRRTLKHSHFRMTPCHLPREPVSCPLTFGGHAMGRPAFARSTFMGPVFARNTFV